jgi:hypothetical protein
LAGQEKLVADLKDEIAYLKEQDTNISKVSIPAAPLADQS